MTTTPSGQELYMLNRSFLAAPALILGACSDGPTSDKSPGQPTAIVAQSGDGQTQVVDRSLPNRIVARVTDARGRSVPNAGVSFEVVSGGGAILSSATVHTDTAGLASASWRLGTSTAVEQAVRARVTTSSAADLSVTFRATSRPALPSILEVQASDEKINPAAEITRVVVAHAYDAFRNPAPDAKVLWSAPVAGTLRTNETVTGPDGATQNNWTLLGTSGAMVGEGVYWITAIPAGASAFGKSPTPYVVTVGDARLAATALAVGSTRTCAVAKGGQVYCWAHDTSGSLADASRLPYATPISAGAESFTQIVAGRAHTCALTTAGKAFCWGENTEGQLGDGTQTVRSGAVAVEQRGMFVSLVAGGDHTCALTDQGAALCWGSNRFGQLGDGSLTARSTPNEVSGGVRFTSLAAGVSHTCGLTTSGGTVCWGSNQFGQIGTSTLGGPCQKGCAIVPTPIEGSFVGLSAGLEFTCGVDRGSVTWCWGAGLEARTRVLSSVSFASLVGSRSSDACGITDGGRTYCWTLSDDLEYYYTQAQSLRVGGALTFSAFRVGDARVCGIERTNESSVVCWSAVPYDASAAPGYVLRVGRP
jgi:hypothetical protein